VAITLDAVSSHNAVTAALLWGHTCAAGAKILVVGVGHRGDASISAATYGGNAMTLIRQASCGGGSTDVKCSLYYLLDPPTGSSLSVLATATLSGGMVGGARSYFGAGGLGADEIASGHSLAFPGIALATPTDSLLLDVIHARNASAPPVLLTVGENQSERWNRTDGGQGRGAGSDEPGGPAAFPDWTITNPSTPHWAQAVVELTLLVTQAIALDARADNVVAADARADNTVALDSRADNVIALEGRYDS